MGLLAIHSVAFFQDLQDVHTSFAPLTALQVHHADARRGAHAAAPGAAAPRDGRRLRPRASEALPPLGAQTGDQAVLPSFRGRWRGGSH